MKAAVIHAAGEPFRIEDVEHDPPRDHEVVVRMAFAGVCHTDLHAAKGHMPVPLPAILGHEGSGVVSAVGPGVRSVSVGDSVVAIWRASCGDCVYCNRGKNALCDLGWQMRFSGRLQDGTSRFRIGSQTIGHYAGVSTFASYSVMPEGAVLKIDPAFGLDKAALFGCCVVTGIGAVTRAARVPAGATMAVFGAGGVGLNVIQGGRLAGAQPIIAVDVHPHKLEAARQFGATHCVDSSQDDPVAAILALTDGRGVEFAFEAVGLERVIGQAYASLCRGGRAVILGVAPAEVRIPIPVARMVVEEKAISGSLYGSANPRAEILELMELYRQNQILIDPLISRIYPLEEINEAFEALERGEVTRSLIQFP